MRHKDYKNHGRKDQNFCSRGHLVPSGAFNTKDERDLTFMMTNVAPHWQPFNGGNWASVERAVKDYATFVGYGVYVLTGTGKYLSPPHSPYSSLLFTAHNLTLQAGDTYARRHIKCCSTSTQALRCITH